MKTYFVCLRRADNLQPWGFRLSGGSEYQCPLHVQKIVPGSIAEYQGLLVGDILQSVGDQSLTDASHERASKLILEAGTILNLIIERDVRDQTTSPEVRKKVVHQQYNSPFGLYSTENISETLAKHTKEFQGHVSVDESILEAVEAKKFLESRQTEDLPNGHVTNNIGFDYPESTESGRFPKTSDLDYNSRRNMSGGGIKLWENTEQAYYVPGGAKETRTSSTTTTSKMTTVRRQQQMTNEEDVYEPQRQHDPQRQEQLRRQQRNPQEMERQEQLRKQSVQQQQEHIRRLQEQKRRDEMLQQQQRQKQEQMTREQERQRQEEMRREGEQQRQEQIRKQQEMQRQEQIRRQQEQQRQEQIRNYEKQRQEQIRKQQERNREQEWPREQGQQQKLWNGGDDDDQFQRYNETEQERLRKQQQQDHYRRSREQQEREKLIRQSSQDGGQRKDVPTGSTVEFKSAPAPLESDLWPPKHGSNMAPLPKTGFYPSEVSKEQISQPKSLIWPPSQSLDLDDVPAAARGGTARMLTPPAGGHDESGLWNPNLTGTSTRLPAWSKYKPQRLSGDAIWPPKDTKKVTEFEMERPEPRRSHRLEYEVKAGRNVPVTYHSPPGTQHTSIEGRYPYAS